MPLMDRTTRSEDSDGRRDDVACTSEIRILSHTLLYLSLLELQLHTRVTGHANTVDLHSLHGNSYP